MSDDSQGGLRGDPVVPSGQNDGTRDQMCNRINELEAARDHLRARLHQLAVHWQALADQLLLHSDVANGVRECAADLLAVLTEPQQHENETV